MAVNFENAKDSEEMRKTIREAREALLEKVHILFFSRTWHGSLPIALTRQFWE